MRPSVLPSLLGVTLLAAGCAEQPPVLSVPDDAEIVLATTTSVRDAGVLELLLQPFETTLGYRVKVIAVGSGQALEIGRRGDADMLITHDVDAEVAFMQDGFGAARAPLMRNEFVVVGPERDEAGVRGRSAADAVRAIHASRSRFVTRADRSGTHSREKRLWEAAGIVPGGEWYLESGQGMSATLQIADQLQAYALTDIGTFVSHKYRLDLEVLVEGDSVLANPYHILLVNPARFPWVNYEGAQSLSAYLRGGAAQRAIAEFGRRQYGRPLFEPFAPTDGMR
ncbi:MAG: substrate-binding domain-containing protein [Gemmatimonadota bacterium]|nr:substrate-binding domain-containing protein [Gemmatimonadota bacterium]MDH3366618.1 substrate-binding domain-containing protein [Gemmatimonadota bacterium]MDH3476856.1 substrate-binding domain-containing protein [Gemmatimonadota bacterium]MDH3571120.1 substrate-binding domain-containing protein [Gemmatimonadota bacterium]MDH5548480.1 substrate-binding domain-containing protein [Gemmatimonadota bacterium]